MEIAVVGSFAPSLIGFRGQLLEAMVRAGHVVTACAPDMPKEVAVQLKKIGVVPCEIPLRRAGTSIREDLRTVAFLRRLFLQIKPHLVLSYTIKPVVYGSLAARSARVPRIASMITGLGYTFGSESAKQRLLGYVARGLYREAMKASSTVFFQNPDDRDLFISLRLLDDPAKAVLINGSGVDLEYYCKVPPVTDRLTFLLIGRLLRHKGIIEYAEAARILKSKYPHVRFRLLGPGDENPTTISRAVIEQWQAEGIIEYLGATKDVRPYLAETSVYVLPSYREGTPRSVLEAMAMGRPIITTDTPGCRETVVNGRNGFLVPVKDSTALAAAMEKFILNPELIGPMGEESHRIARDKYDVHLVNQAIMTALGL